jgi:hypothetical protein
MHARNIGRAEILVNETITTNEFEANVLLSHARSRIVQWLQKCDEGDSIHCWVCNGQW